jgi:hypothetical protein
MPKANTSPDAILKPSRKSMCCPNCSTEKNKNNLKMIAEGKIAGGKQIGPYARLLTFSPGEVIMHEGDWGGNTFYFSLDSELEVQATDRSGQLKTVGNVPPGACFGEMSILAGVPRNATISSARDGGTQPCSKWCVQLYDS